MGDDFKNFVKDKFQNQIDISFAYQELHNVPKGIHVPPERIKPWGTAHAVLVTAPLINEPFAVINADDFYGAGSYKLLFDFFNSLPQYDENIYSIVGYQLQKTLSNFGYVSRAVCQTDENGYLQNIVERIQISKAGNIIVYKDEVGNQYNIPGETSVSMNMMGFTPSIFEHLDKYFKEFITENINQLKMIERPFLSFSIRYRGKI